MIKLRHVSKPAQLTKAEQKKLTALFRKTGEPVWQKKYVKVALLKMSNDKCCYCECKLEEESNYFEVEHYLHKAAYPSQVMEWKNLLPSCKRCNGTKNDHDTRKEPIIHPARNKPHKHLVLKDYRILGKTALGIQTEIVVPINDTLKITRLRFDLGERIKDALENLFDQTKEYQEGKKKSIKKKNSIYRSLRNLLVEGTPEYEYSATHSTMLLNEGNYSKIRTMFVKNGLWAKELTQLEARVKLCALEKR